MLHYVTVTRKLDPGLPREDAREDLGALRAWKPHALDISVLESAFQAEDRYGLSCWDSLIVGAAAASGCRRLLTEDLTDGQELAGVLVVNPFAHAPEDVLRS